MPLGPQSAYAPEKEPPPGGYVTRTNDPNMKLALGRSVQLFYSINNTVPSFQDFCSTVGLMQYDIGVNGASWMIASVQALQVRRNDGGSTYTPLTYNEILNRANQCPPIVGTVETAQRFTSLRARFKWNDGSAGQRELITDIGGGISIQVYARNVSVDVVYPSTGFYAQGGSFNGDPQIGPVSNTVDAFDAMVSARCAPVDGLGAYILSRRPQLTEVQRSDLQTSALFPIPSGATRATLSVGCSVVATRAIDAYSIGRGRSLDRYPNPAPGSSSVGIDIGGLDEYIRIVADAANDNVFSVVYEINP
jgi:hypothetical protein